WRQPHRVDAKVVLPAGAGPTSRAPDRCHKTEGRGAATSDGSGTSNVCDSQRTPHRNAMKLVSLRSHGPRLAGLGLISLLAACGAQPGTASQRPTTTITVAEAGVSQGAISSVASMSGSVVPRWTVTVLPKTQGQIVDLRVQQGQQVNQGDVLAVIDHRSLDDQVAQAQANLTSAQAKLNSLLAGARPEDVAAAQANAAAAQAGVSQAQASLESSKQKLAAAQAGGRPEAVQQAQAKLNADTAALNKLQNGPTQQDVTNARLAVEQAKDKLFADQTTYDRQVAQGIMSKEQREAALTVDQTAIDQANTALDKLTAPPRPEDVAQAKAAVDADQQALALAKQPNRPEDIAQLQQAVTAAESQVQQAQQQGNAQQAISAKAAKPYTGEDIAQARAAVDVAKAGLQSAQTAASDATIAAPASGVISDVPIALGSLVGPTTPIATLLSPDLEVDGAVEESQVTTFKEGQPASISIAAAPQQDIDGKVLLVSPSADPKTRKFTIKVAPLAAGTPLRAGMSATVKVQTGQQAS